MRPEKRMTILVAVSVGILLIVGGFGYFWFEADSIRARRHEEIKAVAELKIGQIEQWQKERIADVKVIVESPFFSRAILRYVNNRKNDSLVKDIVAHLATARTEYGYEDIMLASSQGKILFNSKGAGESTNVVLSSKIVEACKAGSVVFSDFYNCSIHGQIHFDIVAPITDEKGGPIAALVFRVDPNEYLYPLLQSWPVPSGSSETLILRKEGDSVLFLNELRHRKGAALSFKIPLSKLEMPAVQAVMGFRGIFEGKDYRGVKVLADIEPVPNTPWFMIAKVDRSEAYAELYYRAIVIGIFLCVLIVLLWSGLVSLYNFRQKTMYRDLFEREKDLRAAQEQFKTTLYSIGDGVITTDKRGAVKQMNPVAERLTGRSEADARGKSLETVFTIINEDSRSTVVNPVERVLREGVVVGLANHTLLVSKDGKETPIADSGAPIRGEGGEISGVVLVFQDQTDARAKQRELIESETRYRSLFTEMLEGFALHEIICDKEGKPIDYRFLSVNPAFERLTGLKAPEITGKTVLEVMPQTEASWIERYGKVAITGEPVTFENFAGELDRYYRVTAFCPQKGRFAVLFEDITERRRGELLLAQEKERLAVTLRSIGDGVITTDTTGRIVLLNKAAEALTGWKTEEATGRPLSEVFVIVNAHSRQPCEDPVAKVLKTGRIVELANHTHLIARDGRELVIADSGAPIRDSVSRVIGVVLVFRDITEKQKLNDSLQRAQKLESVGVLAGGIAHDFNNLLAGIFGYIDMADECIEENKSEQARKHLSKALAVFERAKALTRQLLTFAKGGAPVRTTLPLAPLIQNSARFALSGSNVTCKFELPGDLWPCDCDENQIGQVIDNIVINAKQAMPMGGEIVIRAENVTEAQRGGGVQAHGSAYIRISIRDQGIGMPREILSRIFDPFFSTKEAGHGLGLATVHSIVQRHDGWIDVESEPGKGSTFHVVVPASQKVSAAEGGVQTVRHTGRGAILVMDDEEFMLEIVGTMLKGMGYTVVQAKNGREARQRFADAETSKKPFVATILDLTIPGGIGGRETAAELRKINPRAVIIAASGYSEDPIMAKPGDHGFTDKIIKPFRKPELSELFERLFGKKT
jgi:PAS domain S-box-containing protein